MKTVLVNKTICWAIVLSTTLFSGFAATITRGPYIQNLTPTSAVVKWRTDVATDSIVHYGTVPGEADQTSAAIPGTRTEHTVTIAGLTEETRYFYDVAETSGILAGGTTDFYFQTLPPPGANRKIRIWAIGDFGTNNDDQRGVRDGFKAYNDGEHIDAWLMLGDHAYNDGTDVQHQNAVFNMYPELLRNTCAWPTRGNHERVETVHYDTWVLPTAAEAGGVPSGTEAYFSYDIGPVHFITIDSYATDRKNGSPMLTWLENDLAATTAEYVVAYWHHPPYTKGSHNSDNEGDLTQIRQNVLPILDMYGVDIVLNGHSHSYERSYPIRGHYGHSSTFNPDTMRLNDGSGHFDTDGPYVRDSETEGVVYAVAGASGKVTSFGPSPENWHPVMYDMQLELGSVLIEVEGKRMDVYYINPDAEVTDEFTIFHPEAGRPLVEDLSPSLVAYDRAILGIDLVSTGNAPTEVFAVWDVADQGTDFAAWANTLSLGVLPEGPANATLPNLPSETAFVYRFFASNAIGFTWSAPGAFTTTSIDPEIAGATFLPGADPDASGTLIPIDALWRYNDSGTAPPANWTDPSFNDASWSIGRAELGYGNGDETTVISYGFIEDKHPATFFRHTFNVTNPTEYSDLIVTLKADDAAIVYLNGTEVHRKNLPAGTVTHETFALLTDSTDGEPPVLFPLSGIVAGENTIAVQVHIPNKFELDLSFALALSGTRDAILHSAENITYQSAEVPGDLVNEGLPPTSVVLYYGLNNGGTNALGWSNSLVLGPQSQGQFPATLTGLLDETDYVYRFRAENPAGIDWSASGVFTTASKIPSIELIGGTRTAEDLLIAAESDWKYLDNGSNQGTAWRAPGFNDGAWASGPAELGYGENDENTVVGFGGNINNRHITTYFRKTFVAPKNGYDAIRLGLKRDDGAVVYLDGGEIARDNLPGGTISYNTAASANASDDGQYFNPYAGEFPLSQGLHTMAVEIHQRSRFSSDISFDLELIASRSLSAGVTNISATAATISGHLTNEGQGPTTVRVLIGTTDGGANPAAWDRIITVGQEAKGTFDAIVTGLAAETTYVYRLQAVNSAGSSTSPTADTFTTLRALPLLYQQTTPRTVSYTEAIIEGFLADQGSSPATVDVFYGLTDGGTVPANWENTFTMPPQAGAALLPKITRLLDDTTYFVRLRASNAAGAHWADNSTTFTTQKGDPIIGSQNILNLGPDRATPSISLLESHGVPVTLTLFYEPVTAGSAPAGGYNNPAVWDNQIDLGVRPEGTTSRLIADLPDETILRVTWRAESVYGTTWLPSPSIFATPSGDPELSTTFASSISYFTATANGTLSNDHSSPTSVTLYWGTSDGGNAPADWDNTMTLGVKPQGSLATPLSGLRGKTTYFYRYYASNEFGDTWSSDSSGFITSDPIPEIENRPTGTAAGIQSATVAGNLIDAAAGPTTVTLYWGTSDGGSNPATWDNASRLGPRGSGPTSLNFNGLIPGTTYYYRHFASNESGSDWAPTTGTFATRTAQPPEITQAATLTSGVFLKNANATGTLISNGGLQTTITLYYGLTDGGTDPAAWDQSTSLGIRNPGLLTTTLNGLSAGATYFYRYFGSHTFDDAWANQTTTFTTFGRSAILEHAAPIDKSSTTVERVLLPRETYWRYLDDGSDQSIDWRIHEFDHRDWKLAQAKFGYGTDKKTTVAYGIFSDKHITTYFRTQIYIPETTGITETELRLKADDGALVYINNVLAHRSNMPTGIVNHRTLALSEGSALDDTFTPIPLSTDFLQTGTNTIAVEVHQSSSTGPTLGFDLEWVATETIPDRDYPGVIDATPDTATLQYAITDDGGDPPEVWLVAGPEGAGDSRDQWPETIPLGTKTEGTHTAPLPLTAAPPGQTIHYRFQTTNVSGTDWSAPFTFQQAPTGNFGPIPEPAAIMHDDDNVGLWTTAAPGRRLLIESSLSLTAPNWKPAGIFLGTGAPNNFLTPISPDRSCYYRLRTMEE